MAGMAEDGGTVMRTVELRSSVFSEGKIDHP